MTVLPGDYIGANEEYIPSKGTFSSDEGVLSSNIGQLDLDKKNHSAKVKIATRVPKLQAVGDIVIGDIAQTTESTAIIDLAEIDTKKESSIPNGVSAVLHVSNIKRGFVEDLRNEVKIGDLVRARIIEVSPHSIRLTIDGANLGVIKAFCSNCRQPLKMTSAKLVCDRCGNVEQRKTAEDYDSGNLR